MKPGRIILAAVVGGVIMFIWGAVSHMTTPIGEMGLKPMPDSVWSSLKPAIAEPGLYFFPGGDMSHSSPEADAAWEKKMESGPVGIMAYSPGGEAPMSPRQLSTEFVSNLLAALVGAVILALIPSGRGSFIRRVLVALGLGVLAWLSVDVSYWNWFKFPLTYTIGTLLEQSLGWLFSGIGMALILHHRSGAPKPA